MPKQIPELTDEQRQSMLRILDEARQGIESGYCVALGVVTVGADGGAGSVGFAGDFGAELMVAAARMQQGLMNTHAVYDPPPYRSAS